MSDIGMHATDVTDEGDDAGGLSFAGLGHMVLRAAELPPVGEMRARVDALVAAAPRPADARPAILDFLLDTLAEGRGTVRQAMLDEPLAGLRLARTTAHLTDLVVASAWHYASAHLHPAPIRTKGEQLAVVAVGGYGRGEMAPFSDVDLLFVTPWKRTAWAESVVESMLYLLWDLRLKVGQAVRSVDECLRLGAEDITIRTNLLEKRLIAGDPAPFETLDRRLWDDLFLRTGPEFVEAKLEERDRRHERHGGSRYLLEPNIKEGKGGLRDLQTLHWISRYLYRVDKAWELCDMGVFEREEVARFAEAAKFIWAVRCHLHDLAGRAQEQLTFDRQVEIAARMGYRDAGGRMGVEHFMHAYFRHAKDVGDLTRIFSAALEAQHAKALPRFSMLLRALSFRPAAAGPFVVRDGRLAPRDEQVFRENPVNLLRLFREAARLDAQIHPAALRLVTQSLDLIDDDLRANPQANALFMEMLTDRQNAEWLMRLMNETDVLGRFVPDFGRIVAMMQFNMYHHYTVDEHTIQTIGVLNRIEQGRAGEEHPVATEIAKSGVNRRVLYTALLFHDIGKGDARDHAELGAEIAERVCPRLGLDEAEAELVVWLVRHHLLMSDVAQKRDIADPVTVADFARVVQSPERLRLLLVLTVCDIRGVGPGVWNNWKAQLLRKLYWDTRAVLTGGGDLKTTQAARVQEAKDALAALLAGWSADEIDAECARHYPHYWLGLEPTTHRIFAGLAHEGAQGRIISHFEQDPGRDATTACIYMPDHPGIFSRMAGAFALAGASVVDARTYTTADGMACSAFWIQDADGRPFEDSRLPRLKRTIERTVKGEVIARDALREKRRDKPREMSFRVPTRIVFDNDASELYTVIEVNARDRLGLLHVLARTLTDCNINIFSAIIATYGEHAVDVFYVKDLFGLKIRSPQKQRLIEKRLLDAVEALSGSGAAASSARS
ncbi:[protein-PII] uridylyltransferase [Limibaculum sp. FT325]|uniref:[protein-PII] uridylyltransferase n=1 Tax=Thermohalobaculum sediminis TaxID=2939436 RepID=UPI0020C0C0CC|nr:[protein-PII] uridylyltransferase [Limibaculum sediminis]MCL5776615.1 [protein-PII] uridylyltransferase [Limibaculum sediminis]